MPAGEEATPLFRQLHKALPRIYSLRSKPYNRFARLKLKCSPFISPSLPVIVALMIPMEKDIPEDLRHAPDEEILKLSLSSPAVFSILFDRYHAEFTRKAKKIVGEEYAEDLVQEAFVKIYLNAGRFKKQEGASFKSWAYRILVNACFTYYKKQKRDREATMPLDEELAELLPNFRVNVDKEFTSNYVLSILSRMPSLFANVLKAYFIEGKPQKEIAKQEGVSVGVIKTRVHRAKKEFKKVAFSLM